MARDEVDVKEQMIETLRAEARHLAAQFTPQAVQTIADIMMNRKAAYGVRRQCAKDLVEIAGAMPERGEGVAQVGSGLTVNILRLSDENEKGLEVEVEELRDVVGGTGTVVELADGVRSHRDG